MADGNGAAVDVQALIGNPELVAAVQNLAGECLVQLPQVDVADLVAGTLEQARHRKNRPDSHFVGLAAGHREAAEDAQRLESALFGQLAVHDHHRAAAVGELAGIAGRDHPARQRRSNLRDGLERRVGTNALIGRDRDLARADRTACLVDDAHDRGHRRNLVLELARALRGRRPQLAADPVFILRLFGNVVALGHRFGGLQHGPVQRRLVLDEPGIAAHVRVRLVLHAGNALDAAGDDDRTHLRS